MIWHDFSWYVFGATLAQHWLDLNFFFFFNCLEIGKKKEQGTLHIIKMQFSNSPNNNNNHEDSPLITIHP